MSRGPKPQTARNRRQAAPRAVHLDEVMPTSVLNDNAMVEFRRLVVALDHRGMLDRADVGIITACARAKDRADRCNDNPDASQSDIAQAENIYLGRLRALALTQLPSRSVVKTVARTEEKEADPVAGKIKLHA